MSAVICNRYFLNYVTLCVITFIQFGIFSANASQHRQVLYFTCLGISHSVAVVDKQVLQFTCLGISHSVAVVDKQVLQFTCLGISHSVAVVDKQVLQFTCLGISHSVAVVDKQVLQFTCLGICHSVAVVDKQDEYLHNLESYDITIPSRVTSDGDHVSYSLHPGHILRRRGTDSIYSADDNIFHYKIQVDNQDLLLKLKPNHKLTSPSFVIERKKSRFKNITDSTFKRLDDSYTNCHFHGEIVNQSESSVAVAVCDGLHGFIHTNSIQYFIEPLRREPISPEGHHKHVVYRRSALPLHLDPVIASHINKRSAKDDDSCGVKDAAKAINQRERWEQHHREKRKAPGRARSVSPGRSRRSVSTERYVETLVVVDPKMVEYHASEHLETYVLTIMNMVATMFHDATVGNSINIVLVRILIMEEEDDELKITHHADNTLKSFCKFQKRVNFKDDDHPNHHDVAILLTRHNICSRVNEPCSTLGLAQVAGMCQPHRSCNINEDTGLALAYTVTHEIGHNFGMQHDGYNNGCEDPPGKQLYIMSPSLVADSLRKSWSNCSKASITKFIDRDWGYCLDDEPGEHLYSFPVLPAGTMYDADHQCRLQYGTEDTEICTDKEDVCSNLWCRINNRCSTHLEAAAEGTICGPNKWCYEGKCVKIGERPESINGEWGQWSSWTDCTRTCGAGVAHSQRHCDNPKPSHGGKFCLGERKRYRICNTEDCEESSASFNEKQCQEFNYIPYKNGLYEWEHVPTTESPCQLHCKPQNQFFSVLLKDIVTDGTPCTAGTRNMCISGRCRHIGCDYMIDSKAIEDRCGVCHGDGSTCKTVKSHYKETKGLGYVQAAVIPTGARNIRVEEVAAANNFLALQNNRGEYYLNGHWFIQWSGDYKIAGTTVHYEREGNMESVTAQGPLKEPLHVMLLLQSENPGVTFEYTVPKDNISESRIPEFNWSYQPWTHCTSSCGGGTQRSEVACTEIEAGIVEDKYCHGMPKPDDKQKVCNEHLCPARWWFGPWQHCSVTCGDTGLHHRTVICVRSLGPDEQIALDDEACSDQEKPQEVEPCHKKEPCAGTSSWIVGEWSEYNENPCGLRYRTVSCEDPAVGCENNQIPLSELPCSNVTCGQWMTEDWMECTRSCGDGIQYRRVVCEGGLQCDPHREPDSEKNCNLAPCPTKPPTTSQPSVVEGDKTMTTINPSAEEKFVSTDVNTAQTLPRPTTATTGYYPTTDTMRHSDEIKVKTIPGKHSVAEHEDTMRNTQSEIMENNGNELLDKVESEIEFNGTNMVQLAKNVKPTTSENFDQSIIKTVDVETAKSTTPKKEALKENDNFANNIEGEKVHNKHRHHHGEYTGAIANLSEKIQDENSIVIDAKLEMGSKGSKTELPELDIVKIEKSNTTSFSSSNVDNSSHVNTTETHTDKSGALKTHLSDKYSETDKSSVAYSSHADKLHIVSSRGQLKLSEMPALPNMNELPPLPPGELPPLPDISELSPLLDKELPQELPSLTNIKGLPSHTDKTTDLSTLPGVESVHPVIDKNDNTHKELINSFSDELASGQVSDADLPKLPDKENIAPPASLDNIPSLSDKDLPPLPDENKLAPLSNTKDIPSVSDKYLLPLPNKDKLSQFLKIEDIPNLSDKDLPALPDIDKLAPLPKTEDIPSLSDKDLPALPDKDKLAPLPKTEDIPSLSDKDLPALPDKDKLAPLPKTEDIPSLSDKDLPALPDKNKLAPLPDYGDLPPLPDLPKIPNLDKLAPLPTGDTEKRLENLRSDTAETSAEVFILKSSTDLQHSDSGENSEKLGGSDMIFSEGNDVISSVNVSDVVGLDRPQGETMERNYTWIALNWTECSRYCGGGVRTRPVQCINIETEEKAEEINCDINFKPNPTAECNTQTCLDWVVSEWDRCSSTCGESSQSRLVYCPKELSCDPKNRPIDRQACDVPKCVKWVSGQWSRCTKTCGVGEQYRLIQCVNTETQQFAMGCDIDNKPTEKQNCNVDHCPVEKAAALTVGCEHNEMSSVVCRALKRMQQCNNRFVAVKCCKTCGKKPNNKHRPKGSSLR